MTVRTLNEAEVFGQFVSDEELAEVAGGKQDMRKDEPDFFWRCRSSDRSIYLTSDRI